MNPSTHPTAPRDAQGVSSELERRARHFWRDVFTWSGSVTPVVARRVVGFGVYGAIIGFLHYVFSWEALGAVPAQFTAAVLVLLLVLRTNAGYERWWEARKLWGGIVNQSRNLALGGMTYGPPQMDWRGPFVRWSAAFCHVARCSLRGERELPELVGLLQSAEDAKRVEEAQHMPSFVALRIATMLRSAVASGQMNEIAFLAVDRERATLIDHVGGCERILKTPLPRIHAVKLRRFIVLYLIWLPLAVPADPWWLPGVVTILVSYPLFAIDQIAVELENPFSLRSLGHLPLQDICMTIEKNLLALLEVGTEETFLSHR